MSSQTVTVSNCYSFDCNILGCCIIIDRFIIIYLCKYRSHSKLRQLIFWLSYSDSAWKNLLCWKIVSKMIGKYSKNRSAKLLKTLKKLNFHDFLRFWQLYVNIFRVFTIFFETDFFCIIDLGMQNQNMIAKRSSIKVLSTACWCEKNGR